MKITIEQIRANSSVKNYIEKADESLSALGYTEHSYAHITRVASYAKKILLSLGYDEREAELAEIAGYIHDIGNIVNRVDHAHSGAMMAFYLLENMGADPDDIATVITAIGHHDEGSAFPINAVTAALILADKTDVRASRVRNTDVQSFDIHDRVNYAVKRSELEVSEGEITLDLDIDISISPVMDYFEIFLNRMLLCRKSAEKLGCRFALNINGQKMI